ncbi:hypothetical protein pah_c010o071 [Parachlamydia acanthamoebae str. Hall's coccus]|nr:hypothetical protein pah_c010o071 [Parachlamydia acanthamoebae str. Hall's coccus]
MSGVAFFTGISIAATGAILDDQNLKITGCALAILGIACFTVIQTNCWTERPVSVIHLEEI